MPGETPIPLERQGAVPQRNANALARSLLVIGYVLILPGLVISLPMLAYFLCNLGETIRSFEWPEDSTDLTQRYLFVFSLGLPMFFFSSLLKPGSISNWILLFSSLPSIFSGLLVALVLIDRPSARAPCGFGAMAESLTSLFAITLFVTCAGMVLITTARFSQSKQNS